MYDDFNSSARFKDKVMNVVEELGTEDMVETVGVTDLPENVVGMYVPEKRDIVLNSGYVNTEMEDITATHEAIHTSQIDKMEEYDLNRFQEQLFQTLIEPQASRYTPGDMSYSELQHVYDSFIETFANQTDEDFGLYKQTLSINDNLVTVLYEGNKEDFEEIIDVYFPVNSDVEEVMGFDEYNEVAELLEECENDLEDTDLEVIMEYEFSEIDDQYGGLDEYALNGQGLHELDYL